MPTEKLLIFDEAGNAKRVKARLTRFLENEPVTETEKAAIRSTLSVPANGEGLTPANNLSDVSSAAASRDNLEVLSNDELARDFGTKLAGPSLSFDGTNDFIEIADDDKFTFTSTSDLGDSSGVWTATTNSPAITDGTGTLNDNYKITTTGTVAQGASTLSIIDGVSATAGQVVYYDGAVWRLKDSDDLPFSVSAFVKMTDATSFPIVSKYASAPNAEWYFSTSGSDDLQVFMETSSGNRYLVNSTLALTSYEGSWIHLAFTYNGAGPNSSNAFAAAGDGITMYVNGSAVAMDSAGYAGTYAGMTNSSQPVRIGREGGNYADGEIKDVKLFNRELSAAEVTTLYNEGQLGLEDQWGGANGGLYSSDFSVDANGWTSVINGTALGNVDTIGGQDDNLSFTLTGGITNHRLRALNVTGWDMVVGKRYKIEFSYYIPEENAALDGVKVFRGSGVGISETSNQTGIYDAWAHYSFELVWTDSTDYISFYVTDGGSVTVDGDGDLIYFRDIKLTQIGTLADFRAENFDTSTGKLYSENAFVGTNNGSSLVGRAYPVYEAGNWTPTITFGGGSTGVTYTAADGYYTRVGNICFFRGAVILSSKGSDTGLWVINGLPYTSESVGINSSMVQVYLTTANGLTSVPFGLVGDGTTYVNLFDNGSTGATVLTDANAQNTTTMRFSGTYQIQ